MGVITPTANGGSYSSTTVTGVGPYTQYGDNYKGGGLASDGIIYLVNFGAPGIGTLNTNTNVFTTNPFNVSPGAAAVAGGVLGPDGNIYCAPYVNLSQLFYFTPGANTINSFAISATVRYSKPFLAPNGKIYCVGSTKIVGVIDPIARTFTEVGTAANQQYGFMVLGGNGVVYAFPQNASGIGTLNLSTNVITANVIAGGTGYYGGILGPDGNIYLYQSGSGNIGVLNTKTNTLSILTYTSSGYICAVLAGNGNIYLGASHVIVFSGVSLTPTLNFCLTPYVNNGANRF
jgi:streptogramin lyase